MIGRWAGLEGNPRAAAAYGVLQSDRIPEEAWFLGASSAEALLALAYEQRTANMIAYAALMDGGDDPAELGHLIRTRLGLTNPWETPAADDADEG